MIFEANDNILNVCAVHERRERDRKILLSTRGSVAIAVIRIRAVAGGVNNVKSRAGRAISIIVCTACMIST